MSERSFDIVLFGATGFTGGLAAEYLSRSAPRGTRWALAGRSRGKLEAIFARLASAPCPPSEVLLADVGDPASLRAVTERTRVVLTTVGPYAEHGMPVVEAAVEGGADYVDITGEPGFVAEVVERFDAKARERGVRLVSCCGFDSVPHDLGALFTAEQLPSDAPMTIEAFVRTRGTFSGGTWHSALGAIGDMRNQVRRSRPPRAAGERLARSLPHRVRWNAQLEAWAVPLPTIDPEIVLRSARELPTFGPDFRYGHYARVRHLRTVLGAVAGLSAVVGLAQLGPTRALLGRVKPRGQGPGADERARAWFEVTFLGEAGGERVVTTVSGGDPGYDETAKMVSESALCLALDRDALPERFGALTTAVAMGARLRERLQAAGIRFEVQLREGAPRS